jgi:uncharacterized protein YjiS (DUF1127 family)
MLRCNSIAYLSATNANSTTIARKAPIVVFAVEWRIIMLLAVIRFLQAWRRYNNSVNELSRLGDRELADIGISRSDIYRVSWDNATR